MRGSSVPFLLILTTLIGYTAFKAMQLVPQHRYLALLSVLPLFGVLLGWQFVYRADPGLIGSPWFLPVSWAGSLTMGLWATFVLLSLPLDLVELGLHAFGLLAGSEKVDTARRAFFSQGLRAGVVGVATGIAALGWREVVTGPRVTRVELMVPGLPSELRGLKISQISDLHVGPTIRKGYVQEVVARTNATEPDLIFVTGDIADAKVEFIAEHLAPLSELRARYGIYYVTGNHEYYWDSLNIITALERFGFHCLINDNRTIEVGNASILVAGIPDTVGGKFVPGHDPDMPKAIRSSKAHGLKILLAHRPEACTEAEPLGFDLQFSGHTHAGQFFPFSLLMPLAHKYYRGLNRHGRMSLYVNQGTGYWGPANRFARPPEITAARVT